MNTLTILLRSFQDYSASGNKVGEESYGFSVFDDYYEKIYMDLDYKEFKEILNSPQEVLELVMQFWEEEFRDTILKTGGFYISDTWHQVDSNGRIKEIA